MLSALLNLPRRRKSSSASPSAGPPSVAFGNPAQVMDREEDGFLLVGQSVSERSTVMPTSVQNNGATMPPPPSYAQVTGTPSLPPASIDTSFHSYPSPQAANTFTPPLQQHQVQHSGNSLRTPNAADSSLNTSSGPVNKSSSLNWGIVDIPFQLSPVLYQTNRPMTNFYVAHLREVDWRQYEYDFHFDLSVKRESELALEMMEDDFGGNGQSPDNSQENSEKLPF